jgi:hypothetical protein
VPVRNCLEVDAGGPVGPLDGSPPQLSLEDFRQSGKRQIGDQRDPGHPAVNRDIFGFWRKMCGPDGELAVILQRNVVPAGKASRTQT